MSGAARKDDNGSGHGNYPSRVIQSGSPNVFINGKPAARVGDSLGSHSYTDESGTHTHSGNISSGSNNVFVNGMAKANVGSSISCGGSIVSGSSNVNVN